MDVPLEVNENDNTRKQLQAYEAARSYAQSKKVTIINNNFMLFDKKNILWRVKWKAHKTVNRNYLTS